MRLDERTEQFLNEQFIEVVFTLGGERYIVVDDEKHLEVIEGVYRDLCGGDLLTDIRCEAVHESDVVQCIECNRIVFPDLYKGFNVAMTDTGPLCVNCATTADWIEGWYNNSSALLRQEGVSDLEFDRELTDQGYEYVGSVVSMWSIPNIHEVYAALVDKPLRHKVVFTPLYAFHEAGDWPNYAGISAYAQPPFKEETVKKMRNVGGRDGIDLVTPTTQADIAFNYEGSVTTLTPLTEAGEEWCKRLEIESWQRLGLSFAVDTRVAEGILQLMLEDGLIVGDLS